MRFQSLLCDLVALAELIPTDIDESELSLNPVILTVQGQVERFPVALKCQKTAIFDDLLDFEIPTFKPRTRSRNGLLRSVTYEMSITSMWSVIGNSVDTYNNRCIRGKVEPGDFDCPRASGKDFQLP